MGKTLSNVDKGTRQDLILRMISERELGTQQDVVAALSDIGVEVAQATVSRDLAELGVLKVGTRYLALPHEPGAAGIEVLPSFALAVTPAQNLVIIHTRDDTAVLAIDLDGGGRLGAAWYRLMTYEEPGYGFVDDQTPEVALAVVPDHRGRGLGGALLRELREAARSQGYSALSLSVEKGNPALGL